MSLKPAKACCSVQSDPKAFSVLTAEAGKTYTFTVDPQSGFATYNKTWSAQYGTISSTGVYTAPEFIPESGIDVITVHFENGPLEQIVLHLSPQTGITPEAPIIVPQGFVPSAQGNNQEPQVPTPEEGQAAAAQQSDEEPVATASAESDAFIHALDNLPNDGKWHEISETPGQNATPALWECTDPIQVVLAGQTYLRVPSTLNNNDPNTSIFLMASGGNAALGGGQGTRRCKIGPIYGPPDWIDEECTNGSYRRVYGPKKTYCKRGPVMAGGTVEVSAEWANKINARFNLGITAGLKVLASRQYLEWTEVYNFDRYQCVGGRWKYVGSGVRQRLGTGLHTVPKWGGWVMGYPMSGLPGPWTDWFESMLP